MRVWNRLGERQRGLLAIAGLIVIGTAIRIPQLFHTLLEAYSFRQTQTALVVREYAESGINLFHTPLNVFGPDSDVPLEFPLWQAIAAIPVSAGVPVDLAVRVLALLSFQLTAVLLAALLQRWHGWLVAVVAVGLLQFLPFGLLWGAASLIDFFAVAASLLMVYGLDRWLSERSLPWLIAGGASAVLAFLVKPNTVPAWGLLLVAAVVLLLRSEGWRASWRRIAIALIGPVIGLGAALAWTAYSDAVKRAQDLTGFLVSDQLRAWYFGTLDQRIDPNSYTVILQRVADEMAGPALVGLLVAVVAVIFQREFTDRLRTAAWLTVVIAAPLVFFNLYVVHTYYLIAVYPAIVAAMAIGLVWAVRLIPGASWRRYAVAVLALGLLLVSTATTPAGRGDIVQFARSGGEPDVSTQLQANTDPDELIVMIGCDWDPTYLYYAERDGVMLRSLDAVAYWDDHDIDDYRILVNCGHTQDATDYLPAGYDAVPIGIGDLYEIERD